MKNNNNKVKNTSIKWWSGKPKDAFKKRKKKKTSKGSQTPRENSLIELKFKI